MRRIASLVAGSLVHAADNGANGPLPPVGTGPLPNVWGGRAFGNVGGVSGHLFAFSGADGATQEGSRVYVISAHWYRSWTKVLKARHSAG